MDFIDAYRHYKNGLFAVPGGVENQPVKYIDAMRIIDGEVSMIEKEKVDGAR